MRIKNQISITARLILLFTGVAAITFVAVGTYLYQALAQQLERRDDAELIGKITLVRYLLHEGASVNAIERSPFPFLDAMVGHKGLSLRLLAADGAIILQNIPTQKSLPHVAMVAADREPATDDIHSYRPAVGSGRILGAIGKMGNTEEVRIIVALEETERAELLAGFRQTLIMAILAGAGLATMFAAIIVRLGLRPLQFIVTKANDITAQRLNTRLSVNDSPRELQKLGSAFNSMLDRLEDSVQRLSRFSADLAHDLRTPINTLMMQTQVALSRSRTFEEYESLLASNIEEYERLARMIENTLFLARADNAQLAVHRESLDVKAELERIRDYFEGWAEEMGVSITVDVDDNILNADPILFQRAVSNLMTNAIQHTPSGGFIWLAGKKFGSIYEVSVENLGPGISAEHLPHVFERYYRIDAARPTLAHASGLGLAIVRAIMHLHAGEVYVQSNIDSCTKFRLCFDDKNSRISYESANDIALM